MEITYNNRIYTQADITNMRNWLNLYGFANWETERIDNFTPIGVLELINLSYSGGVIGFNKDFYKMVRPPFMQYRYNICGNKSHNGTYIYFLTLCKLKHVTIETAQKFKTMLQVQGVTFDGI